MKYFFNFLMFLLVFSFIISPSFYSIDSSLAQAELSASANDLIANNQSNSVGNYPSLFAPGELIITLKKSENQSSRAQDFQSRMMDTVANYSKSVKWESSSLGMSLIKVNEGEEFTQIAVLKQNPNIESVELNTIQHARSHIISTDPDFSAQWHLNSVKAPESWDFTTGTSSVIVAVIDSGVQWTHPDLFSGMWENDDSCTSGLDDDSNGKIDDCRGWDFVNDDNDPMDDFGHGTKVAGIISARLNTINGASMAPDSTLMPIKALDDIGDGSLVNIFDAITYAADNGADVINMSLGSYGTCTTGMQDAIDYANSKDVVVVVAAGAGPRNIDVPDSWPSCNNVISVTATDNFNKSAHYSDWINTIDISAPGGDSPPNGSAGSLQITSTVLVNSTGTSIGTSYSAPHVSGCAALIRSLNSTMTANSIESRLVASATDLTISGYTPNLATVGKDKVFGWGLLQCDVALMKLTDTTPPSITSVVPGNSSQINQFNVVYTLSEAISSGTITFTQTGGAADAATHIYNLAFSDRTPGVHTISKTTLESGFGNLLVNGAIYTMTINAIDLASNSAIPISKTGLVYSSTTGPCVPSGTNWIIATGCKIENTLNPSGDVDITNGAIVTIENTGTLDVNFTTKHLKVESGSGILVKSGGKIK